jgi:hypothetical protein
MKVRGTAELEIHELALWYEAQRDGLGFKFLDAIEVTLEKIGQFPELYAIVHKNARRALLRRFPIAVYFRIEIRRPAHSYSRLHLAAAGRVVGRRCGYGLRMLSNWSKLVTRIL